jgi:transcriptional regulator with XRE-family HTH domain
LPEATGWRYVLWTKKGGAMRRAKKLLREPANPRSVTAVDLHVARKVRSRRLFCGMTQEALAAECKISFQQLQKYENGKNRISPQRLANIASVLKRPVSWFFEGMPQPSGNAENDNARVSLTQGREGQMLLEYFHRIPDDRARRTLLEMARSLAEGFSSGSPKTH